MVQTLSALLVVALAAAWLAWRALARKKNPGCGNDCGCASSAAKSKLAKVARDPLR
jgi:bacterioferritin-associated ferredoxin